ncbi:unnamed protein product [Amoebophrya sp. A25]|nr:unnamed protein product [Amoebophrya sp. A25]|eukprot:GSA25T00013939001.1
MSTGAAESTTVHRALVRVWSGSIEVGSKLTLASTTTGCAASVRVVAVGREAVVCAGATPCATSTATRSDELVRPTVGFHTVVIDQTGALVDGNNFHLRLGDVLLAAASGTRECSAPTSSFTNFLATAQQNPNRPYEPRLVMDASRAERAPFFEKLPASELTCCIDAQCVPCLPRTIARLIGKGRLGEKWEAEDGCQHDWWSPGNWKPLGSMLGSEIASVVFDLDDHNFEYLFRTSWKTSQHFARVVVFNRATRELVAFGKVMEA